MVQLHFISYFQVPIMKLKVRIYVRQYTIKIFAAFPPIKFFLFNCSTKSFKQLKCCLSLLVVCCNVFIFLLCSEIVFLATLRAISAFLGVCRWDVLISPTYRINLSKGFVTVDSDVSHTSGELVTKEILFPTSLILTNKAWFSNIYNNVLLQWRFGF